MLATLLLAASSPDAAPPGHNTDRIADLAKVAAPAEAEPAPGAPAPEPWLPSTRLHPRSVYRISPWADGATIAVGGLGLLLPNVFASKLIVPRCPCSPSEVWGIDRSVLGYSAHWAATVSDVTLALSLALPLVLDPIDVGFSKELAEDVVVYTESLAVAGALNSLAKFTVQRPRPFVYSSTSAATLQAPDSYASFYSGHTTFVVAALTAASFTYTQRHGPAAWPWIVTGVVSLSVAAERVASGEHFYSDVAVGALAGFLCGYFIPLVHRRLPQAEGISLGPVPGGAELSLTRRF